MSASPSHPGCRRSPWRDFRQTHFHDYGRAAGRLWAVVASCGLVALAWAVLRVMLDDASVNLSVATTFVAVCVTAIFTVQIPRTKYAISAADVFIFLLLTVQGVPIAILAAGCEGLIGTLRTSKRLSSRVSTPCAAMFAMWMTGFVYEALVAGLLDLGLAREVASAAALVGVSLLPLVFTTLIIRTLLAVKNGLPIQPAQWLADSSWIAIAVLCAGFVASLLALETRRFGQVVLIVGSMVVITLVLLVRVTLRRRENERVAQEGLVGAAQREAELSQRRFTAAFTHAAIGMAIVGQDGRVLQANHALCTLFGATAGDLTGCAFDSLLHPGDAPLHARRAAGVLARREAGFSIELRCRPSVTGDLWVALHCGQYDTQVGNERCLIYQLHDITSRQVAESRLQHIAYHDGLTDLANRNCFIERLAFVTERAPRVDGERYAVLFLDLDRFKVINDSLGHTAGNELLRAVGDRLKRCVRASDLVARLGGDEFAILFEGLGSESEGLALAETILAALATPLTINGTEVIPCASLGLTFGGLGVRTVEEVLRDADLAMYEAKGAGRGRVVVFDVSMHERVAEKLALESDLRRAIGGGKLTLQFQPIFELSPYTLTGFEALARWVDPERGPVSPAVFVALAEESGYISALTSWVLDRAVAQLAEWERDLPHTRDLTMNVNLSGRDLARDDLVDEVQRVLSRHGVAPRRLTLEITETTLMGRLDVALGTMNALRAIGVRFSIDDFGTGYSSLAYLSQLPIDTLKIDRSFVIALKERPHNVEIVKAILTLGHALGRKIVAEGIETGEQLAELRALGVNYGQGYLLSRPLHADGVPALLQLNAPMGSSFDLQRPRLSAPRIEAVGGSSNECPSDEAATATT